MLQLIGYMVCVYTLMRAFHALFVTTLLAPTHTENYWDVLTQSHKTRTIHDNVRVAKVLIRVSAVLAFAILLVLGVLLASVKMPRM